MADYDPINGPGMEFTYENNVEYIYLRSGLFNSYNIHVLNPNGMPNKPNAMWNQFKITEWIDPSTLDSRGLIHEIYNMSGKRAFIEGDATGNTFSWSTKCNIPDAPHYTASNAGHFTMSAHDGMGGVRSNVDLIYAGTNDDIVYAKTGNDTVYGQDGNDFIDGGAGNDSLDGGADNDTIDGGTGNDYITGGAGEDILYGNDGNDTIEGGDNNDILDGGLGADVLIGGSGINYASYFNSNDGVSVTLTDTAQNGYYVGFGKGGEAEGDALLGIQGIQGSKNKDDILIGNSETNFLYGEGGNDSIDGGAGDDVIYGGVGADSLIGGTGDDTLYGESGSDVYLWNVGDGMDFFVESSQDSGEDTLVIRGTTDLYVLKDGNNLALGTGGSDWAIMYNYFQDPGMEYAVIGNTRYTTSSLAAMATNVVQNSIAEVNADCVGISGEAPLINFADIEAINLMGLQGEQIDLAMV